MNVFVRIQPGQSLAYGNETFIDASDERFIRFTRTTDSIARSWISTKVSSTFTQSAAEEDVVAILVCAECSPKQAKSAASNLLVLCHGGAGTGKTSSFYGSKNEPGLVQRTVSQLGETQRNINVAFIHVRFYKNEPVKGILWDLVNNTPILGLKFIEHAGAGGTYGIPDVCWNQAGNYEVVLKLIQAGMKNIEPEVGHTVLCISLETSRKFDTIKKHCITFVDLCGVQREAIHAEEVFVNSSVSALETVLQQLGNKPQGSYINFHSNKLTHVLQPVLTAEKTKWCFFLHVSAEPSRQVDTCSTLDFAQRLSLLRYSPGSLREASALVEKGIQVGGEDDGSFVKIYAAFEGVRKLVLLKRLDSFESLLKRFCDKFCRRLQLSFTDHSNKEVDIDDDESLLYALKCRKGDSLYINCRPFSQSELEHGLMCKMDVLLKQVGSYVHRLFRVCSSNTSTLDLLTVADEVYSNAGEKVEDLLRVILPLVDETPVYIREATESSQKDEEARNIEDMEKEFYLLECKLGNHLKKITSQALRGTAMKMDSGRILPNTCVDLMKFSDVELLTLVEAFPLEEQRRQAHSLFDYVVQSTMVPFPYMVGKLFSFESIEEFSRVISAFISIKSTQGHQSRQTLVGVSKNLPYNVGDVILVLQHVLESQNLLLSLDQLIPLMGSVSKGQLLGGIKCWVDGCLLKTRDLIGLLPQCERHECVDFVSTLVNQFKISPPEIYSNIPSTNFVASLSTIADMIATNVNVTDVQYISTFLRQAENMAVLAVGTSVCTAFLLGIGTVLHKLCLWDMMADFGLMLDNPQPLRVVLNAANLDSLQLRMPSTERRRSTIAFDGPTLPASPVHYDSLHLPTLSDPPISSASSTIMKTNNKFTAVDAVAFLKRTFIESEDELISVVNTAVQRLQQIRLKDDVIRATCNICKQLLSGFDIPADMLSEVVRASSSQIEVEAFGTGSSAEVVRGVAVHMREILLRLNLSVLNLLKVLPTDRLPVLDGEREKIISIFTSFSDLFHIEFTDSIVYLTSKGQLSENANKRVLFAQKLADTPMKREVGLECIQQFISKYKVRSTEIYEPLYIDNWKDLMFSCDLPSTDSGKELLTALFSSSKATKTDLIKWVWKLLESVGVEMIVLLDTYIKTLDIGSAQLLVPRIISILPFSPNTALSTVQTILGQYPLKPTDVFTSKATLTSIQDFVSEKRIGVEDVIAMFRLDNLNDFAKLIRYFVTFNSYISSVNSSSSTEKREEVTLLQIVQNIALAFSREEAARLVGFVARKMRLNVPAFHQGMPVIERVGGESVVYHNSPSGTPNIDMAMAMNDDSISQLFFANHGDENGDPDGVPALFGQEMNKVKQNARKIKLDVLRKDKLRSSASVKQISPDEIEALPETMFGKRRFSIVRQPISPGHQVQNMSPTL